MRIRAANWLILLVTVAFLGCDTDSTVDPPEESYFVKFYGNEGNQTGVDAVLNADGTVTLFGTTESKSSGLQLYLVNIEPNGRIIWEQSYGGPEDDIAKDIELTNDGRLVILSDYGNTTKDIVLMTLSTSGSKIDSTLTGFQSGSTNTDEIGISVTQTNDGFLVSGSTNNLDIKPEDIPNDARDALHLRYLDDLSLYPNTWRQARGPGEFDEGVMVIQIPQAEVVDETQFYFFGYSNRIVEDPGSGSAPDLNPYILGLGGDGETTRDYNFTLGIPGTDEIINSVELSPIQSGEGYVLAGVSTSGTASDIFITKLRKKLSFQRSDFLFQKNTSATLGLPINSKTSIYASSSSGFLILSNEKQGSAQNFYLERIDSEGNLVWTNPISFGGEQDDSIGSVLEFPDGSIGMVGTFSIGQDGETKMTFIKVNKEGKFAK